MISSGDQQEKANVFCVYRQWCVEELQEGEHSGEKSLIRWSIQKDLFSSVFATFAGSFGDRIHTEVNSQIVVSDFFT